MVALRCRFFSLCVIMMVRCRFFSIFFLFCCHFIFNHVLCYSTSEFTPTDLYVLFFIIITASSSSSCFILFFQHCSYSCRFLSAPHPSYALCSLYLGCPFCFLCISFYLKRSLARFAVLWPLRAMSYFIIKPL